MKTFSAKASEVPRKWWVIDAKDQVLGQVAVKAANLLRGKEKTIFTPHVDTGDYLVVVNAEKVAVTGNKLQDKMYFRTTGYIGNLKSISLRDTLSSQFPERVIETAVKGMLPKNPLGRAMFKKLKVYKGPDHPHAAQQPQVLDVKA